MRLSSLLIALLAAAAPSPAGTAPVAVSAFTDGRVLRFDSPMELPWSSWLPANLQADALNADTQRREELFAQRSDFGSTEVAFSHAVTPELKQRFYYLLDPTGIREIRPTSLAGTARIEWLDNSSTVSEVRAFGQVVGSLGGEGLGGFVLVSQSPLKLVMAPSHFTADGLLSPQGAEYRGRGTAFREIVAQYQVREAGTPPSEGWIWVQWKPDEELVEAGCQRRFSLFRPAPGPAEVATTDYGCDV
ncbi:MAG TPA: hypothetical protein VLT17_07615 [Gemmatimonadales bacterium]|jgi:hypothetical protein|nr:hypothetical protein [Gemmatimonadales bacterium]